MKVVSNGARLKSIKELEAYEYSHYGMAWMPIGNDRMAYVLVGSNNKDAGNWDVVFEADLIPYTGKITDYNDTTDINGDQLIFDTTWYFQNGYIHGNPAMIHIVTTHNGVNMKKGNAVVGLFEGPSGEDWALAAYKKFGGEE